MLTLFQSTHLRAAPQSCHVSNTHFHPYQFSEKPHVIIQGWRSPPISMSDFSAKTYLALGVLKTQMLRSSRRPRRDSINFSRRNSRRLSWPRLPRDLPPSQLFNGFVGSFAGNWAEEAGGGIGAFSTFNVRYAGAEGG